ncbi:MAG: FkbM family methyltransferase [Rhodobacteraceae bacterium]|nr:FkbM family methyltransferase [Paracoccaceae bacterium]
MDAQPFLRFCEEAAPVSHGQNLQDLFCLWASGLKRDGYFVEFGALAGRNVSNSWLLEQLGWNGIVAEPHPDYSELLHANRACNVSTDCVWKTTGETVTFKAVKGRPALSGIGGLDYDDQQARRGLRDNFIEHKVRTISLVDLLKQFDAPKEIDCLSIDTEGSELEILRSFDFSAYRFGTIVAEHSFSSHREPIREVLNAAGYYRIWTDMSDHDDWFVHASYADEFRASLEAMPAVLAALSDLECSDNEEERLVRLSSMMLGRDMPEAALRCAKMAALLYPEAFRAQLGLAQMAAQLVRTREAIVAYRKAIKLNPGFAQAKNQLARLEEKARG